MHFRLMAVMLMIAGCEKDPEQMPDRTDPLPVVKRFFFTTATETSTRSDPISDGAVDFAFIPGEGNGYFVIYRDGAIERRAADNSVRATRKLAVRQRNECGGLAVEVDPDFATNARVYVGYCVVDGGVELRSFEWDDAAPRPLLPAEMALLFTWPMGANDFHNLGDLGWDGEHLWLTYGDGNRSDSTQMLMDLRGKLLRVTPHRDGRDGYEIPSDNPFVADDSIADEVVAWGIKSVFRAWYEDRTWFLGDVGVKGWEEVNLITLGGPGRNMGFPICEGPVKLDGQTATETPCDLSGPEYVAPAIAYPHDPDHHVITDDPEAEQSSTIGFGVTGGMLYRGDQYFTALDGWYLYSDNQRDFVRRARFEGGQLEDDQHFAHLHRVWSWTIGTDGYIYALTPTEISRLEAEAELP
jgi:glucose/arabinose dehydrogenase